MEIPFGLPAVLKKEDTPENGDAPVRLSNYSVISGGMGSSGAETCVCGAVFGPSGILYDSEKEFDFDAVYSYYRQKICDLNESKVRFLLLNRQTSLADMRAALLAARDKDLPVAACLTAGRRSRNCSFLSSLITLQAMGIQAFGLCGIPDEAMLESIRRASAHTTVPLIVIADAKPNQSPEEYAEAVRPLLEAGVRLLGCGHGTTPEHYRKIGELAKKFGPPDISEEPDCLAAASDRETFFLGEDIRWSEPLPCSASLVDKLIDLDDEQVNAALVYVESVSDAELLGKCVSMSRLPIAVRADSPVVLDAALRYVQGRLIVDSGSSIERDVLEPIAAKYGAIVY